MKVLCCKFVEHLSRLRYLKQKIRVNTVRDLFPESGSAEDWSLQGCWSFTAMVYHPSRDGIGLPLLLGSSGPWRLLGGLTMKAVLSSKTSVNPYQSVRLQFREDFNFQIDMTLKKLWRTDSFLPLHAKFSLEYIAYTNFTRWEIR